MKSQGVMKLLALGLLVALLPGCGDDDDSDAAESASTTTTAATPTSSTTGAAATLSADGYGSIKLGMARAEAGAAVGQGAKYEIDERLLQRTHPVRPRRGAHPRG
jgi:hypothetical protein